MTEVRMKVSPRDAFYRCWAIGVDVVLAGLFFGVAIGDPVASPWKRLASLFVAALFVAMANGFLGVIKELYLK